MKILRQETLEHDNLYDSLILYEMNEMYAVVWNGFKLSWHGIGTRNDVSVFDTLEEATKEFERKLEVLS